MKISGQRTCDAKTRSAERNTAHVAVFYMANHMSRVAAHQLNANFEKPQYLYQQVSPLCLCRTRNRTARLQSSRKVGKQQIATHFPPVSPLRLMRENSRREQLPRTEISTRVHWLHRTRKDFVVALPRNSRQRLSRIRRGFRTAARPALLTGWRHGRIRS